MSYASEIAKNQHKPAGHIHRAGRSWIQRPHGWKLTQAFMLASHTCQNVAVLSVLERRGTQTSLVVPP